MSRKAKRTANVGRATRGVTFGLCEDHVVLNEHPRDKAGLKSVLTQSFAAARDLVIVNDICDISVATKKRATRLSGPAISGVAEVWVLFEQATVIGWR